MRNNQTTTVAPPTLANYHAANYARHTVASMRDTRPGYATRATASAYRLYADMTPMQAIVATMPARAGR